MSGPDVMFPEEQQQMSIDLRAARSGRERQSRLLIDQDGQQIADAGDVEDLDVTSLSSLTAGNIAATGGIAKLLREKEFSSQFHEGEKTNIHISLVGKRVILVVIFDERSSLGLVRLRVQEGLDEELARSSKALLKKVATENRRRSTRRSPRSPTTTSTTCSTTERGARESPMSFINYSVARDQLQDRLLRARPVREDDQPAVHLRRRPTPTRRAR